MKQQKIYLEHANITVRDIKKSIHFFQTVFPHFRIRGGGNERREWIHLGDEHTYIAINQGNPEEKPKDKDYDGLGINHIGFVVDNVEEIALRLLEGGYERDYPKQVERFRIRDYFIDSDGNEFEFVEYLSEIPEERNSYKSEDSTQ